MRALVLAVLLVAAASALSLQKEAGPAAAGAVAPAQQHAQLASMKTASDEPTAVAAGAAAAAPAKGATALLATKEDDGGDHDDEEDAHPAGDDSGDAEEEEEADSGDDASSTKEDDSSSESEEGGTPAGDEEEEEEEEASEHDTAEEEEEEEHDSNVGEGASDEEDDAADAEEAEGEEGANEGGEVDEEQDEVDADDHELDSEAEGEDSAEMDGEPDAQDEHEEEESELDESGEEGEEEAEEEEEMEGDEEDHYGGVEGEEAEEEEGDHADDDSNVAGEDDGENAENPEANGQPEKEDEEEEEDEDEDDEEDKKKKDEEKKEEKKETKTKPKSALSTKCQVCRMVILSSIRRNSTSLLTPCNGHSKLMQPACHAFMSENKKTLMKAIDPNAICLAMGECTQDEANLGARSDKEKAQYAAAKDGNLKIESGLAKLSTKMSIMRHMRDGEGRRWVRKRIAFPTPFRYAPFVHLGISDEDIQNYDDVRVKVVAENVDRYGFDLAVSTWKHTKIDAIGVSWMAYGKSFAARGLMRSGRLHATEPEKFEKKINFPVPFKNIPTVLMSFSGMDASSGRNVRAEISATKITESGFTAKFEAWGESVVHWASASWVAVDAGANVVAGVQRMNAEKMAGFSRFWSPPLGERVYEVDVAFAGQRKICGSADTTDDKMQSKIDADDGESVEKEDSQDKANSGAKKSDKEEEHEDEDRENEKPTDEDHEEADEAEQEMEGDEESDEGEDELEGEDHEGEFEEELMDVLLAKKSQLKAKKGKKKGHKGLTLVAEDGEGGEDEEHEEGDHEEEEGDHEEEEGDHEEEEGDHEEEEGDHEEEEHGGDEEEEEEEEEEDKKKPSTTTTTSSSSSSSSGCKTVARKVPEFSGPPGVRLELAEVDFASQVAHRVELSAVSITTTGFKLRVRTWGDTRIHSLKVSWLAHERPVDWDPNAKAVTAGAAAASGSGSAAAAPTTKTVLIDAGKDGEIIRKKAEKRNSRLNPGSSCKDILERGMGTKDGEYWVFVENKTVKVYCDMKNGGWMRVINIVPTSLDHVAEPKALHPENLADTTAPAKLSDAAINHLATFKFFKFTCADYVAYVSNDKKQWTSKVSNTLAWNTIRTIAGKAVKCDANMPGYTFADVKSKNPQCQQGAANYGSMLGNEKGCFAHGAWGKAGALWIK